MGRPKAPQFKPRLERLLSHERIIAAQDTFSRITLGADGRSPFFGDWALTFFYDYGRAWDATPDAEIDAELTPEEPMRSVGAAIAPFGWGGLRIEVAKPLDSILDTDEKELTYYVRWSFDF